MNHSHPQRIKDKDNHFATQKQKVYHAFADCPKTMLMVAVETNILRANICQYVAQWETEGRISLVKSGICPISKHRAGFYANQTTV